MPEVERGGLLSLGVCLVELLGLAWIFFVGLLFWTEKRGAAGSICFFRMLATCFEIVVLFL